ncbi:MAG: signal recognition particle protein [Bacillota bacterium]|nr:signal recognition particle protein [Bacillota bacterium]
MAFEGLMDKLSGVFSKLKGHGKVTEADIKVAMREVKLALLEADVNFRVVKDFIEKVSERCKGSEVLESLTPGQQVIKIVREELIYLMGKENEKISFSSKPPTIIMMVGLQGAGKTTTAGKLAALIRKDNNKRPLLVACDIYRPAAIKQLEVVGAQINVPVFTLGDKVSPVEIAQKGVEHAKQHGNDLVIIDTAGRLHIDEKLMEELSEIKEKVNPDEILLVVDSMTGQDAVNVAASFNEQLEITGVVLTKLDGDTRGGAALSVRAVSGKPVKFACIGEKMSDIEPFFPDRMASRILGMGDVLTLIDKAQEAFDEKQAQEMEKRLRQNQFTLDDFLVQMSQIKKMGSVSQLMGMIPGMGNVKDVEVDDKKMGRIEAIILSMTPAERGNPSIINGSRKIRISKGSGTQVQDVNQLLRQFEQMQKMIKQMMGNKAFRRKAAKGFNLPF